jgi:hypothetical protein
MHICVFDLADLMYGCGVCMAQTLMHIYSHGYSVYDLADLMYMAVIHLNTTLERTDESTANFRI